MADGKPAPPIPGSVMDGYRYMGGDPSQQENWISAEMPKTPAVPVTDDLAGKAIGVGKSLLGVVPYLAPAAAATAAGMADPLAAPITAPLAYGAVEGLINPKEVQAHPVAEGLTAASMALPGPAEAVHYAFPRFAVEHPGAIRAGGAALGGLLGTVLGQKSGYGGYGELGGGIGGAFLGYKLGAAEASEAGKKLIDDVIEGKRPSSELPPRLIGAFLRQEKAIGDMALRRAAETGEPMEMARIPAGARSTTEKMFEQRAKMIPNPPNVVLTPDMIKELEAQEAYKAAQREAMEGTAKTRGMAHAAGEHSPEWVPSKKGVKIGESTTYRVMPKGILPFVK